MTTVVALHAHPDDESLLTGGTLAMLATAGHRVVLVVATSGGQGLAPRTSRAGALAVTREAEVDAAAQALGCARTVHLGYRDSGWNGSNAPVPDAFSAAPVAEVAALVASILVEEAADVLLSYDRRGGYGHPDHCQVHRVAVVAARLAGTPRVLEATVDRTLIAWTVRVLARLRLLPAGTDAAAAQQWYSARQDITHRVRVYSALPAKRRALACHASQTGGGRGPRTVTLLLRLPRPVFALVAGVEWYVERDAHRGRRPLPDLLLTAPAGGPV